MNEMKNEMKDGQTYGDVLTERFQFYQTLDKKKEQKIVYICDANKICSS